MFQTKPFHYTALGTSKLASVYILDNHCKRDTIPAYCTAPKC